MPFSLLKLLHLHLFIASFVFAYSASATNSQYQVITLCNTQPSILKCHNKLHYLIIHRALIGISNTTAWSEQEECRPQPNCMQEFYEQADSTFECTGSKICVVYPNTNSISVDACSGYKSNLTQLHITCASLG
jgi:hypothetical protein